MRIVILAMAALATNASVLGDESLPAGARTALEQNSSLFSNVLITGAKSRRVIGAVEAMLKKINTRESAASFTNKLDFELRFQGLKFRESIEYPPSKASTRDVIYEASYNGNKFYHGCKRLKDLGSSSVEIFTPSIAAAIGNSYSTENYLASMEFWYLHETGFTGPLTISELGQPVTSTILKAARQGQIASIDEVNDGGKSMLEVNIEVPEPWQSLATYDIETHEPFLRLLDGTGALQMQIERERRELAGKRRVIRFWLNTALGYAVEHKWELRKETGETISHTANSDFVLVDSGGVWMPKRCVVASHSYKTSPLLISTKPLFETVIQMDQCKPAHFDGEEFRIWYDAPGALVSDYTSPKATLEMPDTYRVPSTIDDLPGKRWGTKRWLIVLNVLFLAGWLGWWYYSRSAKS